MGILQKLGTGQGYLKMGFHGFQGSGKTYTAIDVAIGLREFMKLTGPIAFYDTEGGSEWIANKVLEKTGLDLVGVRSRSFVDLMETMKDCVKENVSVLIIDSLTHVWGELQAAHLQGVNVVRKNKNFSPRYSLEFQDWGPIKKMWGEWITLFLNSKLHIIICARSGYSYDHETNQETGKKDLVKTGTKVKAENEFGFEPSLFVEMNCVNVKNKKSAFVHRATILKDRSTKMNGMSFDNPTFETFLPHISELTPGAHAPIDTSIKTESLVDDDGRDSRTLQTILSEEIQGELLAHYPGQTVVEKQTKAELVYWAFNTRSWTAVEKMDVDKLRAGLKMLRGRLYPTQEVAEVVDESTQGK